MTEKFKKIQKFKKKKLFEFQNELILLLFLTNLEFYSVKIIRITLYM